VVLCKEKEVEKKKETRSEYRYERRWDEEEFVRDEGWNVDVDVCIHACFISLFLGLYHCGLHAMRERDETLITQESKPALTSSPP